VRFLRHPAPTSLLLASLLLCATSVVASAESTLDQAQDRSWNVAARGLTRQADVFVQTFTAGLTGQLDRVEIPISFNGHPGDLMVDIRATGAGHLQEIGTPPNQTAGIPAAVLGHARMPEASLGEPDPMHWVSVMLPTPVHVEAGVQYGLDIWQPDQQAGFYFLGRGHIDSNGTDWYRPGRILFHLEPFPPDRDGTWWTEENLSTDYGFRTFVTPDIKLPGGGGDPGPGGPPVGETPELSSLALLASGLLGFGGYARLRRRARK
jgi:hypothetical protein